MHRSSHWFPAASVPFLPPMLFVSFHCNKSWPWAWAYVSGPSRESVGRGVAVGPLNKAGHRCYEGKPTTDVTCKWLIRKWWEGTTQRQLPELRFLSDPQMVTVLLHTEKNFFFISTCTQSKQTSSAFDEIKIITWEIITDNMCKLLSLCWALFSALCILIILILTKPWCRHCPHVTDKKTTAQKD